MSSFNDEHTLRDQASQDIESSYTESMDSAKNKARQGLDIARKVAKSDNPIKKQLMNKAGSAGKNVASKAGKKLTQVAGQAAKKAAQVAGKFVAKLGIKLAGAGIAAIAPYAAAILAALAVVAIIAVAAGIIVDEEYSRTTQASYQHVKVTDSNKLMKNFTSGAGNIYFNPETKRYELAKGKAPTEANKLYYVYYAIMANQSRWFVEYERTDTKPGDDKAGTRENPYFKPVKRDDAYTKYTLDGYMFNNNVIDKVGLRPVDSSKKVRLEDLIDESSADSVKKLSMNVNLLYLLNSTMHGSMMGTGKEQMFFTEQFVKPVYHDKDYNFQALTTYRDMTPEEKEKYKSKAHGDSEDGLLETEFQKKYAEWGRVMDLQNEARGGSNSSSSSSSSGGGGSAATAEGIENEVLKKAVEWGLSKLGTGITYSMEGSRTGADGTMDCSGFISTALKEGAGLDVPLMSTVTMLQNSNALGQSGTIFREVDYKTAKKGTIIVVGGLSGGGAGGHTFFLLEDFHGDDTKVLECSYGYNGLASEGTFRAASMNYNQVVALEPTGNTGKSDTSSSKSSSKKSKKSSRDKKAKTDFSESMDNKYKDKISTGILEAQSRVFDTEYDPTMARDLARMEAMNYPRYKPGDYLIHKDDISKVADSFDHVALGKEIGNVKVNADGSPQVGLLDNKTGHYKPEVNPLGSYVKERDDLMKYSLENGYNPALVIAMISVLTDTGVKSMDVSRYNFLNDPEVLESASSNEEEAPTDTTPAETPSTELSSEGESSGGKVALKISGGEQYGKDRYDLKKKFDDMGGGIKYMMDKVGDGDLTLDKAKELGISKKKYNQIVELYGKLGGKGSLHTKMKEKGIKVYTYNGSGAEDKEALKVISINGKTDDTEINGDKKYYVKNEYVRFGSGVTDTKGSYAIKRDDDGNPQMKTGIWDYGFGSIIKMAKMKYFAYEIGIDKHGNYYIQRDENDNIFERLFNGPDITSDTQYQILGATTAFGSLDLSNEIAESQYKIEQVIEKLKRGEVLNGDDISTLQKHKENSTSIKIGDQVRTVAPGNFIVTTKPVLEKEPVLSDSNGAQYLMDYVMNYETYVPSVVNKNLDVVERYRTMNDVNQKQQEAINKIADIFNDSIENTAGSSSSGGGGGEYDASRFTGKTYKGTGAYKGDIPIANSGNAEQDEFLNKVSEGAMNSWVKYGVLPSVVIGQAILESGWGRSALSQEANNLFGVKGTGDAGTRSWSTQEHDGGGYVTINDNFASYSSWNASIESHGKLISGNTGMPNYLAAVKEKDALTSITAIWKGGYATAPDYPEKIMSVINSTGLLEYDKYAIEYTDKNGFEATASGQVNPGGADSTSSVSGNNGSTVGESVWGDGEGFWEGVVGFFTDIQDTFLSIFNSDESFDPTMFSLEQIKNEDPLYDTQGKQTFNKDELIINGSDAYRWKYHKNKLSQQNAEMLVRQFVSSIETRDNRPVYYDEIVDNFNDYEVNRILEENFKDAIVGLFKKPEDKSNKSSSGIRPEITADLFAGQKLSDTSVSQVFGWYKDGDKVKFSPGFTMKGEGGKDVNALKSGKVVFVGDTDYGKTVIIRSNNNTEQIAYVGLGQTSVKVDDAVSQATPIGKADSSGDVKVWGIRSAYDASKGLPPVPKDEKDLDTNVYFDLSGQFGIPSDKARDLQKKVNGWDTVGNAKKPSPSEVKDGAPVKLGDYIQTSADFIMPLRLEPGQQVTVTSPFGEVRNLILQDGSVRNDVHNGVDFVTGSSETMVIAAADGEVVYTVNDDANGIGVVIKHNEGLYTTYWHQRDLRVSVGQKVKQGDEIGIIGTTGPSTGIHLHFGVSTAQHDGYVNPMNYIK